MKAAAGLCFGFAKRSVNCADSVLNNIRLAFAGAFAQRIRNCRRRRFGPAGLLGFRATVTPRPSGSVVVSGWSHRLSILVAPMSGRMKAPSASDRPRVSSGGSTRMIRFFHACVKLLRRQIGTFLATCNSRLCLQV
jgi:hypothetical protein